MSPRRRAVLLVLCLLAGAAVGFCGYLFTDSQWWFVAIPAAVAGAWLAVANPERCISREAPTSSNGQSGQGRA